MGFKRADVKTGFLCNNNCLFCVQAHKKKFGNRPKEDLIKDMEEARMSGCQEVVFTGGEVTIRKDLFDLIMHARRLGFDRIQLQSNSRMLASRRFCEAVVAAGANEFGPALHGHTPKLHDYLTQSEGSFYQTTAAIRNLREMGQYIITNSVVVKPNYRYLPELAHLLIDLGVDQYQFAFMHAVGNALTNYDQMMPLVSEASPFIKQGLQVGIDAGIKVMAEAMPFCVMEGYEKYCSEFYIPSTALYDINAVDPSYEKTRKNHGKIKFERCKECRWDNVCEGPWKEYPKKRGDGEFQPVRS